MLAGPLGKLRGCASFCSGWDLGGPANGLNQAFKADFVRLLGIIASTLTPLALRRSGAEARSSQTRLAGLGLEVFTCETFVKQSSCSWFPQRGSGT